MATIDWLLSMVAQLVLILAYAALGIMGWYMACRLAAHAYFRARDDYEQRRFERR